jgi:hypothetical protein
MSSILARLTFGEAVILTADEAMLIIAQRGEWSVLAQRVADYIAQQRGSLTSGEAVRFDSLGLTQDAFPRTKEGTANYSGIIAASRAVGLQVKRTVDDGRAFYVPRNPDALIESVKVQRTKAAAKAKAKAAAKKAAAK